MIDIQAYNKALREVDIHVVEKLVLQNIREGLPVQTILNGGLVYSSRGVHWVDPSGKLELELSEKYQKQAEDVESAGYQRLASTLRSLVVVGVWPKTTIEINPRQLSSKEIVLTGNRYATRQEIRESLELVRRGLVKPAILNTFPLEETNKAHELIDEMKLTGRSALIIEE